MAAMTKSNESERWTAAKTPTVNHVSSPVDLPTCQWPNRMGSTVIGDAAARIDLHRPHKPRQAGASRAVANPGRVSRRLFFWLASITPSDPRKIAETTATANPASKCSKSTPPNRNVSISTGKPTARMLPT